MMMGWKVDAPYDVMRRVNRVRLVLRFPGWTLEYIDGLSMQDRADILGVLDAQSKYDQVQQQKANTQRRAAARRGRKR
jgi:hypothetical protein